MNVSAVGNNPNEEALLFLPAPQGQTRHNFAKRVVEVVIDIFWIALLSLGLALLSLTFVNDDTGERKMGFGGRSFLWILVSAKIMPWSDYFWISMKVTVFIYGWFILYAKHWMTMQPLPARNKVLDKKKKKNELAHEDKVASSTTSS